MKKQTIKYTLSLGFLLFIIACSVKKDRFVNRKFHGVTTEYNINYNGISALEKGISDLNATYKDNFWELLPVERMQPKEEALKPGQTKNKDFERAEEKAVKGIRKHSMNIGGLEKNPEMDESYLLLAKARYYDGRFLPSLEALNYILYKYPLSDRIYHSKIWREKVNIRLDNNEIALKNLKKLVKDKKIQGQDLADAHAMLSQAYINLEAKDSAVATLKIAKESTKIKEEKARYTFLLGQIYTDLNHQDSAFASYEEVIQMNRQAPRQFLMQAHAKQALLFDYGKGDTLLFVKKFDKLIADRENKPYLDVLNHQMALFYDKLGNDKNALKYYNKSLRTASQDKYLVASNYRNTAEIYFEKALYKTAGKYYDSTLVNLEDKTREHRKIKKKRENLDDVIKYETIAQQNDSILSVALMTDNERVSYYSNHIEKLKIEDEKKAKIATELAKKEAVKQENNAKNQQLLSSKGFQIEQANNFTKPKGGLAPPGATDSFQNSNFYFYNPATVAYGKKDFLAKWGNRTLKENWKWYSNKDKNKENKEETTDYENNKKEITTGIAVNPLCQVSTYTDKIPTDQKILDSLANERNFAYYQLGLIYKEKFKENKLAATRLEQLLKNNPEEHLILPAKYNLYKIYQEIDSEKAALLKEEIISSYPNSRYAEILSNAKRTLEDSNHPDQIYKKIYKQIENNELREVGKELEDVLMQFEGDESISKFLLLKAKLSGRLKGLDAFKKQLKEIALAYPNLAEGKEADNLLKTAIPKLEALRFNKEEATEWKIIFPKAYKVETVTNARNELHEKLELYLKDSNTNSLKKSTDIYNEEIDIITLHGFQTKENASSVLSLLREYKNYKIQDEAYYISTEDYKTMLIQKKLEQWIKINK